MEGAKLPERPRGDGRNHIEWLVFHIRQRDCSRNSKQENKNAITCKENAREGRRQCLNERSRQLDNIKVSMRIGLTQANSAVSANHWVRKSHCQLDGIFLQSSQPRLRVILARVKSRIATASVANVRQIMCWTRNCFVWSGGLTKFAVKPGGAGTAPGPSSPDIAVFDYEISEYINFFD